MFERVCNIDEIVPNTGVTALIDDTQIAVFRIDDENGSTLYAVSAMDPFANSNTIARGLVGSQDGIPFVAAPTHKQRFNLITGECLSDPSVSLLVYNIETDGTGVIYVEHR